MRSRPGGACGATPSHVPLPRAARPRPACPSRPLRLAPAAVLALALGGLPGCVYFNTFYNAKRYYAQGEKLVAADPQGRVPPQARTAFEKSIGKSSSVLSSHPDSKYADDALLLLGKAHYRLGNHAEAATALRALVEDHAVSGLRREAMVWLVRAGRESGDAVTASRLADELLGAGDLSAGERLSLDLERAQLAVDAGDPAKAVAIYEELQRTHPAETRRAAVPLLLARARLDSGDRDGALRDLRGLVEDDRDAVFQGKANVALAEVLSQAGFGEEARETYLALLEGNVADSLAAQIHVALAEGYRASGDAEAAAAALAAAARRLPSSALAASAFYHQGLIQWHDLGRRDAARETFLEAYLQDPQSAPADSATAGARTLGEIRHYESILDGSERVLSPLPAEEVRATATYLLAELVYTAEGDRDRARELFNQMLQLYPASAWTPKVLYTLAWLAEDDARSQGRGDGGGLAPEAEIYYRRLAAEFGGTEYSLYAGQRLADAAPPAGDAAPSAGLTAAADEGTMGFQTTPGTAPPVGATPENGPAAGATLGSGMPAVDSLPPGLAAAGPKGLAAAGPGGLATAGPEGLHPAVAEGAGPGGDGTAAGELLSLPSDSSLVRTVETPVKGGVAADPAKARALASDPAPSESVDEKLLAFTRALPRAPDPLVGLQDRLLARRRELEPERAAAAGQASRLPGRDAAPGADLDSLPPGAAPEAGGLPTGGAGGPVGQPPAPGQGEPTPQSPGARAEPQVPETPDGRDELPR